MNSTSDPLAPPSQQQQVPMNKSAVDHDNYSPATSHLKTYTAGEDASRLAKAAKEFGLQHRRQPRPQVRRQTPQLKISTLKRVWNVLKDSSVEESRMLSVYSSHSAVLRAGSQNYEYDDYDYDDTTANPLSLARLTRIREGQEAEGYTDTDSDLFQETGDEEDYDENDEQNVRPGGTLTAAVLGIIKGMVGPAILYLPHGFANAGYLVALPLLVLTTIMFLYSSQCLLLAWQHEQPDMTFLQNDKYKNEQTPLLAAEVPSQKKSTPPPPRVLLSYPELAFRAFGSTGESIVKTGIALMQSGVCLTYLIFVPQNLHTSMAQLFGPDSFLPTIPMFCDGTTTPSHWLILMVAIQIPLSWIRDIRKLTLTNLLANLLILYGLITCLAFAVTKAVQQPTTTTEEEEESHTAAAAHVFSNISAFNIQQDSNSNNTDTGGAWKNVEIHFQALQGYTPNWFLFIGTSVLLFEGSITLLVPLQEAVQLKSARRQFPQVYRRVILCIIGFYAFFGISCWMAFGPHVNVVLTTSLPAGALATSVQLAYSIAVIFTFPLQNFPALEIACRTIQSIVMSMAPARTGSQHEQQQNRYWRKKGPWSFLLKRNVISSCLVAILAVVAVCTMDSLDKVVSLMGSLLGCPIAFVFPPLIHSWLLGDKLCRTRRLVNYMVAGLGMVAMILASIITLKMWD